MKPWLKKALVCLGVVLLAGCLAFVLLPPKGTIPILNYHFVVLEERSGHTSLEVSTKQFEKQMWFLRTFGYRPLSIDEFYEIKRGAQPPRGREVVVTFDDGNQTYVEHALPILKRFEIPSVNFLVWESLEHRLHGGMNLNTVRSLAGEPMVSFGSHTLNHATLTEADLARVRDEIIQNKEYLEDFFRRPIRYFAYPSGAFDEEIPRLVEEAGHDLAFTTSWKHVPEGQRQTSVTITRVKISPRDTLVTFWFKLSGLIQLRHELKVLLR